MGKSLYETTLVLGGSRSGKTGFAENYALQLRTQHTLVDVNQKLIYVATCPRGLDSEMEERIRRHRHDRSQEFFTVENRFDLAGLAREFQGSIFLLDCLTLWLFSHQHQGQSTQRILETLRKDLQECQSLAHWIIVSNEVGMGIVPAGQESREFRDLAGWANQLVAELSPRVYFVVAGLPWLLKPAAQQEQKK